MAGCVVTPSQFMQFLVDQQPVYDELIMADIRVTDSWIGNVATGTFPAHEGVAKRLDRFKHVHPNTTKVWSASQYAGCIGTPCDKTEHCIGWGSERIEYHLEEQSWCTPLLCFDSMMHVTHSEEQFEYIIGKILRPATSAIMSMFLRKHWLQHAANRFVASRLMPQFTYNWTVDGPAGDEEYFLDMSVPPNQVFKLVAQMLQRRFNPLMLRGYAGENPFKETSPFIELVGGIETAWELDKLGAISMGSIGGAAGTTVAAPGPSWRFTEWSAVDAMWRYGFSGQLGNFQWRADPMEMRFDYVGDLGAGAGVNRYRYQLILPYVNQITAGAGGDPGLGSIDNPHFQTACFAFTGTMHKRGMTALFADATPINPEMPFSARDFGGKWQFVMDNLGAAENGVVIENKRRNKGQFIADFKLAVRPEHNEFMEIIFHKREPLCVPEIDVCNPCAYPVEVYNSCPGHCD
jgi:hypothetical protein